MATEEIVTGGFNGPSENIPTLGFSGSEIHIVERIIRRLVKVLKGLQTTGDNVYRDLVYPPENLPCISVMQGADIKSEPTEIYTVNSDLTVNIMIFVKGENFTTLMNRIRKEVYAKLLGSKRLSLSYVDNLVWLQDEEPEISGEAESTVVRANSIYTVSYQHELLSKSI